MKLTSQMNKIKEYAQELNDRTADYEKLIKQHDALIEVVESCGRLEEFPEDFLESLKQVRENAAKNLEHIGIRVAYADAILAEYEKSKDLVDRIVTLMFNIFGVDVSAPQEEIEEG